MALGASVLRVVEVVQVAVPGLEVLARPCVDEDRLWPAQIGDSLVAAGKLITELRSGIDFAEIDYVARANELTVPIVMMHGTEDSTVPYSVGRALADARPDLIEFHPVSDAAHVRAWNEDRQQYCDVIESFLERLE